MLGDAGEVDSGRAAHWLRKAAKQGHVDAAVFLGILCFEQPGAALCPTEPFRWLHLGAEQGDLEACYFLGRLYADVRATWSCARLAAKWYRRAAEHGHDDAAYRLSFAYEEGGVEGCDPSQVRLWLEVAADGGHDEACYSLGLMCLDGEGGPRDSQRATDLFLDAAHRAHVEAFAGLAHIYSGAEVDPTEPVDALEWLRFAAPLDVPLVQALQGLPYLWGIYTDVNPDRAFKWFARAATTADPAVRTRLGNAFLTSSYAIVATELAYALALLANSLIGGADSSHRLDSLSRTVTAPEATRAHCLLGPPFSGARH